MAVDMFLKIEDVPGESTDDKHKGEIDVLSFSWGLTQPASPGRVSAQDFNFVVKVDKASPVLYMSCATGKHIKKAILYVRKAGGDQLDYIKYSFEDILVSSFAPTTKGSQAGIIIVNSKNQGVPGAIGTVSPTAPDEFASAGGSLRAKAVEYAVLGMDGTWYPFRFDFAGDIIT